LSCNVFFPTQSMFTAHVHGRWYTLPLFTGHDHGDKKTPVNMGVIFVTREYGCHIWSPCSQAPVHTVNTGVIFVTRVHGPCSRVPLHTTRFHGPWTLVTKMTPVFTAHVQGCVLALNMVVK